MRIVITGGTGQLGTDVTNHLKALGHDVHSFGREELDITNMEEVRSFFTALHPEIIVHSAAYTKVDLAEAEVDEAFKVNGIGTRNIAVVSEQIGAKMIYISTDYVFDGTGDKPYHEFMLTTPINVYGKSKWAGEQFVQQLCSRFFILRTSWVYGKHGQNFVKTMLSLAQSKNELSVVHDQVGSPTYTVDLAKFIGQIIETDLYGIYHTTNSGYCSWYEFAREIFLQAGLTHIQVKPVTTSEFPRPAKRPANSRLDHMAIRLNGLEDLRHWKEGLHEFLKEIQ